MIVGLLGLLKAGGAYVPLDPVYPEDRLTFMVENAQVSLLLTQKKLVAELPISGARVVCLDRDWEVISQESEENPVGDGEPKNLAYVIYTSGSTGQPKGVMVTHRSLVNAYQGWEEAYQLRTELTSHLQMASFSFDVFSGDLIRALCSGGKLVLCPQEWLLEPKKLYQLMRQEKVDCAEFVPAVLRTLVQYLENTEQNLNFMKVLVVGSDSLYIKEYEEFKRFCSSDTRFINSYGASEATIDSTYFERTTVNLPGNRLIPIGRPFANTHIYLLDPHLQVVPIGVPGELHIGGAGLARGYLNRPELTAEKFISNPFPIQNSKFKIQNSDSERFYKTGDLARYLPDGNIELLGRIDHQVKIRGFRIELGEIEACLNQHPTVLSAVVVAREVVLGSPRLVTYIVPRSEPTASVGELRSFLKTKLPEYMIPSAFVMLEALPLTPNGKVDRRSLPAPDTVRPELEKPFVAPRTEVEERLAAIWSDVLGLEQIGVRDNFFELGGHSLLATQVVSRVRESLWDGVATTAFV
jgi:amino acid adenylation domain-containing protein